MESLPVTLIVKAPNQQFEDQTIKCEPTWSIRKLKGYLSEVYPCNPSLEEQKLIYSGQLLNDAHILKDVLRQYEGQETHTVHLVYTPKNRPSPPPTIRSHSRTTDSSTTNQQTSQSQSAAGFGSDGLRQRIPSSNTNAAHNTTSSQPQFANGFGYMANPYMATMPPQMVAAQQQFAAQQMAVQSMMQQMYVQYMNQMAAYTQQLQHSAAAGSTQPPPTFVPTPFYGQNMTIPTMDQAMGQATNMTQANVNGQEPQNAAAPNGGGNVAAARPAAAVAADDEAENRDWLETLYTLSRLAVLLSLVYFYSSPGRCSIVIICIGLYYWYQNYNRNQRQQQQQQQPQIEPGRDGNADAAAQNERENDPNAEGFLPNPEGGDGADEANEGNVTANGDSRAPLIDADENRLTTLALLRTFISSFFSSLIPETPAV